ncbi:Hypothetical predicted protein [Mytilus galloprovincialis]|uniref:Uncharacterized protein n=1 Tax=Mytilus galloprovincialis TaxID=29158 RepID=A0A8B6ERA3_MYTGA|nr:Hypothetical predicted protein [Mytilus galloprovincialis]
MKSLSDIIKKVKSSASVQLFEKDLKDVKENLKEIIKYLNRRINTSNIQKTKAAEQIRSMRKSIDDLLNKLEQEILNDLDSKQSKLKSQMNTLQQQLKTQANQMSQLQSEFSKMTEYATELQMYVGLREIEKTTSEAAKYLDDLKSEGQLDEVNLELTISSELQSILKDVKSFGDININTSSFTLQLKAVRKDQAQYLVHTTPTIEQIKPSLLRHLTIPQERKSIDIHACTILPDVASDGQILVVSSEEKSTIVNLNDMSLTILKGVVAYKIALFKGNIYGTICRENKVCCYTRSGEPLWTFMHDDIVRPLGITLDKNGFVYVVSTYNNRVVVVSPDGKTCKTILSKADRIKSLCEIDINRESGIMIASSEIRVDNDDFEYETTFVYKL